jgi:hypothetical protein
MQLLYAFEILPNRHNTLRRKILYKALTRFALPNGFLSPKKKFSQFLYIPPSSIIWKVFPVHRRFFITRIFQLPADQLVKNWHPYCFLGVSNYL